MIRLTVIVAVLLLTPRYLRKTRRERFWGLTIKPPETAESMQRHPVGMCWIWNGRKDHGRYGRFESTEAHRVAYELQVGPIPDGLQIDHLCQEKWCVRPSHLEAVTASVNTRRIRSRSRGERSLWEDAT